MEFSVSTWDFTLKGVESLAKMKHLKYLCIKVDKKNNGAQAIEEAELLVHAAGRVPNLLKVDFDFNKKGSWEFVKLYGELFPDKHLLIRHLE